MYITAGKLLAQSFVHKKTTVPIKETATTYLDTNLNCGPCRSLESLLCDGLELTSDTFTLHIHYDFTLFTLFR